MAVGEGVGVGVGVALGLSVGLGDGVASTASDGAAIPITNAEATAATENVRERIDIYLKIDGSSPRA